jgi:hypothetical protein
VGWVIAQATESPETATGVSGGGYLTVLEPEAAVDGAGKISTPRVRARLGLKTLPVRRENPNIQM